MSFSLLFTFCYLTAQGQSINGKVISATNALELFGVSVTDSLGGPVTTTDQNGNFELLQKGVYTFQKTGYHPQSLFIGKTRQTIVQLIEIPMELNEVVIKSNRFHDELKTISSPISLIDPIQISSNDKINFAPVLNSVPGVVMQNGTLNTNRITIRGVGSRNLFGTSKIRAYYEDIPLTNGSGETSIEDLELAEIGSIEVTKGPSSSAFGAGLGGNIQIIPNKGVFDQKELKSEYQFGSYGLHKLTLGLNLGNQSNAGTISYSNTQRDGYRENNEISKHAFNISSNHYLNAKNQLVFIGNLIDLKAYIPSSLNREDYLNQPEKAAFTWGRSQGFEDYTKLLLGVSWKHDFGQRSKLTTSIFGNFFNSYEARPFNILDQKTTATGLRAKYVHQSKLIKKDLNWTLGVEYFQDRSQHQTFENLYQDFPPGTGSVQGDQLSDLTEKRHYINFFLEAKYIVTERLRFDFGLNLNKTNYNLADHYNSGDDDLSGEYQYDPILSPKFGLSYQLSEESMVYGSISHGFSHPKLEETLLPNGLINTEIEPETGWSYEIGSRGKFIKNIFQYDVSVYLMNIDNLLVARRTGDDQFIGVNAGKTEHIGLELALNYFLIKRPKFSISHQNSWALNRFTFKDFVDLEEDYSGNDLTGVPDQTFYSQLHFSSKMGLYAFVNYQYVGEMPMRDDNSVYSESYQLLGTKIGYQKRFLKHFEGGVYLGINNILDEKYAPMIQINAGSFGNNPPRYYYPGEPLNYYSGLQLKYTF